MDDLPQLNINLGGGDDKLSEKELKLSAWFLNRKVLLKKILTGALIGISGILWLYSLVGVVDWAFVRGPKERENLKTILSVKTSSEAMKAAAAADVSFGEAEINSGGLGKYDMFSLATNENDDWWAEFKYRFVGDDYSGKYKTGFILPSGKKYITDLGVEESSRPQNIRLEVSDLKYHHISPHEISDYKEWASERLNFVISNKKYSAKAVQASKNISALTFTAENDSAYSFWDVGFYALLYKGSQLASISYLDAEKFQSGESRDLQIQFYEGLPTITKTEIIPEVNIFDKDAYMK